MNKKGFTLVELLAVIFIIILIGSLAFVSINEKGEKFKDMSNEKFEEMIETAAKGYVAEDAKLTNSLKRGDTVTITLRQLVESKYLSNKELKSPKTYEEIDIDLSTVVVNYLNYNYVYVVNLNDPKGEMLNNTIAMDGLILNLAGNSTKKDSSSWTNSVNNEKIELKNFAGTYTSGWYGKGLVFDGEDDGIYLGDKFKDLFKNDFTMEIYTRVDDSGRAIILGNYNNANTINIEKFNQNGILFYNYNSSNTDGFTSKEAYFNSSDKMNLIYTFDKDTGTFSFGYNGVIFESITNSVLKENYDFTDAWIGRDSRTGTTCLKGTIYSIRIYDRVLGFGELQKNYSIDKSLYMN